MSHDALMPDRARVMTPRLGLLIWAACTALAMQAVNMALYAAPALAVMPAFALLAAGVLLLWWQLPAHYPHPRFGACNGVTLLRAGLGASLLTPLLSGDAGQAAWGGWAVALVALFALLLDGVDGWLARRQGLVVQRDGQGEDLEMHDIVHQLDQLTRLRPQGVDIFL